jgi:hypothetical protein
VSSTDEEQLGRLCDVLNEHHVVYVIFGSFAGRLQGADLRTVTWTLSLNDRTATFSAFVMR